MRKIKLWRGRGRCWRDHVYRRRQEMRSFRSISPSSYQQSRARNLGDGRRVLTSGGESGRRVETTCCGEDRRSMAGGAGFSADCGGRSGKLGDGHRRLTSEGENCWPIRGAVLLRRELEEYGGRRRFLSQRRRSFGATMREMSGGVCTWRRQRCR